MLTFDNVRFQYDCEDFSIIDHLSFAVQDGEFVSVIGPSGCGKSTIFRLVNKLLPPAEGNILVNGQNISGLKNYCGYMPQQDMLFPWRTVKENVMLPMEIQGSISKAEMEERADQALESVGLKDWGKKSPRELSGGMRQRAAFARTVRILVVEETPITHLKSIEVPAEYPRTREELTRPEIVELKENLIEMLRRNP